MSSVLDAKAARFGCSADEPGTWEPSRAFLKASIAFLLVGSVIFEVLLFFSGQGFSPRALIVPTLALLGVVGWLFLRRDRVMLGLTVLGAGLLWAGWFGFNAGSSYEASARAAGALLATQLAAGAGALCWGVVEMFRRQQMSVLGMATGAIAGLIAVTPASGYVGVGGALAIGAIAGVVCFVVVTTFKHFTKIDDSLDVFALHGVGGLVGTVLTPVFATATIAPVTATVLTNLTGGLAVMAYAGGMTWLILKVISIVVPLRVGQTEEKVGLDISQHGEMLSPNV